MTKDQFLSQIDRLISVFGEKNFPEERIKTLWEKIKHEDYEQYVRATNKIILERFAPPPASVIMEAIRDERRWTQKSEAIAEIAYDCSWCGQSGFVTARRKESKTSVAFRCACVWFSSKARGNFVTWSKDLGFDFIPEFYHFDKPGESPYMIKHRSYEPTREQRAALSFIDKLHNLQEQQENKEEVFYV